MLASAQKAELDQTSEGRSAAESAPPQPLNPCELEIDLFCKGMRAFVARGGSTLLTLESAAVA